MIFAGDIRQQDFIAGIFPQLALRYLAGYNVTYSRGALMPALLQQLPRLRRVIKKEHEWLRQFVADEAPDGVISDNRYGLWHPEVPAVLLTHQLSIKTGFGLWADSALRRIHNRYLRRFSACWIVDATGANNLAGTLSHPANLLPHAHYIGWLSQLDPPAMPAPAGHLLVLLSGPEPQRTMLADVLWAQVCTLHTPVVFVEGSAQATARNVLPDHISYHQQVSGPTLQILLEGASIVVCRSGYSTLMDLVLLRKKAILIPTPGQTEQEYLARNLASRGIFYTAPQKAFSLSLALEAAQRFPFRRPETAGAYESFIAVLDAWVAGLGSRT